MEITLNLYIALNINSDNLYAEAVSPPSSISSIFSSIILIFSVEPFSSLWISLLRSLWFCFVCV